MKLALLAALRRLERLERATDSGCPHCLDHFLQQAMKRIARDDEQPGVFQEPEPTVPCPHCGSTETPLEELKAAIDAVFSAN